MKSPVAMVALVSLTALAFSGCTASTSNCVSAGQTGVSNMPGSFSLGKQVSSACDDSETYTWQNSGTAAEVTFGSQLAKGSLSITLKDSMGKQVYSKSFSGTGQAGGSERTAVGAPGAWKIELKADGITGQLGLTVSSA